MWTGIINLISGAVGIWNKWFGGYASPDCKESRTMENEKEKQDEFARLVARAKEGDCDAQEQVRKRMSAGGRLRG